MFAIEQTKFNPYVVHRFFTNNGCGNRSFIGQVVVYPYKQRDFMVTHVDLPAKCFDQALLQLADEYQQRGKDLYGDQFPLTGLRKRKGV